jgi:DNA-directed RNA polymerase specialized sigma24 family protein
MAKRDEDIERRLQEWVRWRERQAAGGGVLGFARCGFEPVVHDRYRQAAIPTVDCDASITDQAVLALASPLRAAVEAFYLRAGSVGKAAARLCIGESTLHMRIGQAHQALRRWFNDRAEIHAREAARVQALQASVRPGRGSFTD